MRWTRTTLRGLLLCAATFDLAPDDGNGCGTATTDRIGVIRTRGDALSRRFGQAEVARFNATSGLGSASRKPTTRLSSRRPHCSSSLPACQAPPWSA